MDKYPNTKDVKVGNIYILQREEPYKDIRFILAQVRENEHCLISLENGNRWHNPLVLNERERRNYGDQEFTKQDIAQIFGRGQFVNEQRSEINEY